MKRKAYTRATRFYVPALTFALTLSACQKQEEQSGAEQQSPSLTERAAELQGKAEEAAATTAEKARGAAAEAKQKVETAVESAGEKTRQVGETITEKALSQPEPLPPTENDAEQ